MSFSLIARKLYPKIDNSGNHFLYPRWDPWLGLFQNGELIAMELFPGKRFENGDEFQCSWTITID